MNSVEHKSPNESPSAEAVDNNPSSAENSSQLSAPTVEENKAYSDNAGEEVEEIVVPEKPASAYATVSIMCLCMACLLYTSRCV